MHHKHARTTVAVTLALALALGLTACNQPPTPTPPLTLQASTTTLTVQPGNTSSLAIDLTPHQGFTGTVTLSLADSSGTAPTGLTLAPSTLTISGTQPTLTGINFQAASTMATGSYALLLEANGNGASSSLPLNITIDPNPTPDFTLALSPMALTSTPGVHATTTLLIAPQNGFTGTLTLGLTDSNQQPPTDISLSPATVTIQPGQTTGSPLTIYPSASLPAGTYSLTLTATGNGTTHTSPLTLTLGTNASGTFQSASGSPITLAAEPFSLAVADINRDGRPDIATVNPLDNTLTLLLGDGAGNFTVAPASPLTLTDPPDNLVMGDLNHDGNPDIAATTNNGVIVLVGDGTGGFTEEPTITVNSAAHLAIGDLNNDGNPDIAVSCGPAGSVTILLGDGNGGFTPSSPVSLVPANANDLEAIKLSDVNHDGSLDVVVTNPMAINALVALGDGTGNFTVAGGYSVASIPNNVAVADFNRDGNPDLATVGTLGGVTVLLGDGTGDFSNGPTFPIATGVTSPKAITTGDFNGDGIPDIAIGGTNGLAVLLGNGTGNFTIAAGSPYPSSGAPSSLVAADVNTDGILDLVAAIYSPSSITVLLGR